MAKRNIESILAKGSAKQRMLLLSNHIAETTTGKSGFLSESDFDKLVGSFKTPAEIKLYNRYKNANTAIQSLLPYLAQLRLLYREQIARIDSFCLLAHTYEQVETLVNSTLSTIKSDKQRTELLDTLLSKTAFFYAKPLKKSDNEDPTTYKLSIEDVSAHKTEQIKSMSLTSGAHEHKSRATEILVLIKTVLKALKDYVEQNDFQITSYNDFLKEVENEIAQQNFMFTNFKKSVKVKRRGPGGEVEEEYHDFYFYPEYNAAGVDELEYNRLRRIYL